MPRQPKTDKSVKEPKMTNSVVTPSVVKEKKKRNTTPLPYRLYMCPFASDASLLVIINVTEVEKVFLYNQSSDSFTDMSAMRHMRTTGRACIKDKDCPGVLIAAFPQLPSGFSMLVPMLHLFQSMLPPHVEENPAELNQQ